jgi:hypothetical protein
MWDTPNNPAISHIADVWGKFWDIKTEDQFRAQSFYYYDQILNNNSTLRIIGLNT